MRKSTAIGIVVCLLLGGFATVQADDQSDATAVIDKAIKAMGGEERLAKHKAFSWKGKGTINAMGQTLEYTGEFFIQTPDKVRVNLEVEVMGMKLPITQIFNGDKGWMSVMGNVMDTNAEQLAEGKAQMYAGRVVALLPLKEKGYKLAPIGESKVGEQMVVGIKVSHEGQRDINLYFDKTTGLLAKDERRVKDPMSGQEFNQETVYSNYKDFDGHKMYTKTVSKRDGNPYVDADISEYKWFDKLEDNLFEKPGQ